MAETHASAHQKAELKAAQTETDLDIKFESQGEQILACVEADGLSLTVAVDVDESFDEIDDAAVDAIRELKYLLTVRGAR